MKNNKGQILAVVLPIIAILIFIGIFAGRYIGIMIEKKNALPFADEGMTEVFTQLFDKEYYEINEDDFAQIEGIQILTYDKNNYITFTKTGYAETLQKPDVTADELSKYMKEIDITDININSYDDVAYLKNLKTFYALYTGFSEFPFLKGFTQLEDVNLTSNYECKDFSFLSEFTNLKKLTISECIVDDLSFISGLTNLEELTLSSLSVGDYMLYDIAFLEPLTNLRELNLTSNMVFDIAPLKSLTGLEELYLGYNSVEDVSPIAEHKNLKFIDLTFNLVEDVSPLTHYDPDNFELIILDLNESIDDWSPLDYLGQKVQGRPIGYVPGQAQVTE